MTDRLRKLVNQVFDEYDGSPPPIRERLVNAFSTAGVTLPPEPEIPVPLDAISAFNAAKRGPTFKNLEDGLRAAYPHIVAAVIDALPPSTNGYGMIAPGYSVPKHYLHRALKSSKAT
jgi:hypothetical protein